MNDPVSLVDLCNYLNIDNAVHTIFLIDKAFFDAFSWNVSEFENFVVIELSAFRENFQKQRYQYLKLFEGSVKFIYLSADPIEVQTLPVLVAAVKSSLCTVFREHLFESILVTTYSAEYLSQQISDIQLAAKGARQNLLDTIRSAFSFIYHFPLHLRKELPNLERSVEGFELCSLLSHQCRKISPFTLRKLNMGVKSYSSVHEVLAADVPPSLKRELKHLAYELAGAVVYNLGLDPTGSIFAMGKTSSIVGHNFLPMVEGMATSWSEDESRIVDGFKLIHPHRRTKLSPAAVVLVDRSEDYFTALSCGGKHPLAHRIVNTLKAYQFTGGIQDSSSVTGQFGSLSVQHAATITPGNNCVNTARRISSKATQPLLSPMSGLTRLSFHLSPTLSYRYEQDLFFQRVCANNDLRNIAMEAGYGPTQHENNLTHLHILSGSEESGRDSLVANLKTRIAVEGGRIPLLKKHGLGAEVLAYVQALIESPGMGEGTPMKYSPRVCIQSGDMIGLALAVVEAMQRSSVKQFQTICDWKCSYDIRCSREAQLQQQLSRKPLSLDDCIESLHSQFESRCQRAKRKDIVKDKGDENNTVDAIHTITEIIRMISLFRFRDLTCNNLFRLEDTLVDFLLNSCCDEELAYLVSLQFLSKQAVADIALCRQMISEAELVIKADLDVLTTQSPHLGIYKSNCTENGDIVDWDLDWDTDEPTNAANDKNVALNKLLEEKIAANAKVINHFKTSVSEGVRHTMGAIHELITQFDATKHLPKNTNDAVPTNLCPDILSVSPTIGDSKDEEPLGVLAKLVEEYLHHRQAQSDCKKILEQEATVMDRLEYIESPLQQMKRAGLGLLSQGLGRLGFSNSVANAASVRTPAEQPVLVLFVLGGITYKEIGQIRTVLQTKSSTNCRVVLVASDIVNNDTILHDIFAI